MVQAPRLPEKIARSPRASKEPLILAAVCISALLVGIAPTACLTDATVPPCVLKHNCGGGSGQVADAGEGGELPQGGSAGRTPEPSTAGAGGTPLGVGGRGGEPPIDESGAAGAIAAGAAGTNGICNTCVLSRTELPSPCLNDAYSTDISVSGGVSPYHWQVSATAGTWDLQPKPSSDDHSQAVLTGSPAGAADLRITVTDGAGYVKEQVFSLLPRSACYFAYVASDVNGPKLALEDPQLGIDASEKLTNNHSVYDFQFSPDGRFLAYRYGEAATHPNGAHLSLLDFSTMQDQTLALAEDAVNAYAWSPDSKILAVAFVAGSSSELSAVKVATADGSTLVTALTPIGADDPIESNLFWVDTSFVSFFSATTPDLFTPPGRSSIFYASLNTAGFDAPLPITDFAYKQGFIATPAPGGLFVTSPKDNKSFYNAISLDNAFGVDHQTNFVDPAGSFSAAVVAKTLELFQASDNSAPFENSGSDETSNCPKLLTWASGRERVACVANVSQATASWGEVRIFDAGSATPFRITPSILKGACLKDAQGTPLAGQCSLSEYDYDETTSVAQPRLLSPSGKWLAFITGAQSGSNGALYWANLDTTPINVNRKVGTPSTSEGSAVTLAFSPSERYILIQSGNELDAHLLSAGPNDGDDSEIDLNVNAPATPPCAEDFATASNRWCGGANSSPSFVWSPDTLFDVVAYRKADKLMVVELNKGGLGSPHAFDASACDTSCSGQYAFQPPSH